MALVALGHLEAPLFSIVSQPLPQSAAHGFLRVRRLPRAAPVAFGVLSVGGQWYHTTNRQRRGHASDGG